MMLDQIIAIPADHPSLPGHFPNNPVVPGAVLLDHAVGIVTECCSFRVTGVRAAKFLRALKPEESCRLQLTRREDGALKLTCSSADETVLTAILEGSDRAARS